MVKSYYLDTSIWMDVYEDRKGYNNEPLGDFALKLLSIIKKEKYELIISDVLMKELENRYSASEIQGMMSPFKDILRPIFTTAKQRDEAKRIALERTLPKGDALHAILARDHNLILVTRDKDFRLLQDISSHYLPEEFI